MLATHIWHRRGVAGVVDVVPFEAPAGCGSGSEAARNTASGVGERPAPVVLLSCRAFGDRGLDASACSRLATRCAASSSRRSAIRRWSSASVSRAAAERGLISRSLAGSRSKRAMFFLRKLAGGMTDE